MPTDPAFVFKELGGDCLLCVVGAMFVTCTTSATFGPMLTMKAIFAFSRNCRRGLNVVRSLGSGISVLKRGQDFGLSGAFSVVPGDQVNR